MTAYTNKGILNDPFFQEFNLLFRNGLKANGKKTILFSLCDSLPGGIDPYKELDDEFYVFEIPIASANKEDIQITKTSDNLRIKYTRPNKEDENRTWVKRSIVRRDFDLSWKIPSKFDHTGIQSVYESGMLTIYIPFAKEAIPEQVQILDTGENWKKLAQGKKLN